MAKKTQGLSLGVPRFLWRRYMLPGLILPCLLLMWDVFIEPMIPAANDAEIAPAFYMFCAGVTVLLAIGCLVVGLRLFAQFRRFAQTVIDNGCQNCLRCARSLAGLPAEHNCPACGTAYEMEIAVAKWRKATTIDRSALIAAKCVKWIVIIGLVAAPLAAAGGYYGGLREKRLYEEKRQEGVRLHALGEYAQAEKKFLSALSMAERFFDEQDHRIVTSLTDVGNARTKQGRDDDAIPMFQRALALAEQAFGPQDPEVGVACLALARIHHRQLDYETAEPFYQRALEMFRNRPGTPQRTFKTLIEPYVRLLRETGRDDEADRLELQLKEDEEDSP